MRISKIEIKNFRSIQTAIFDPAAFNVMVGRNNHGKTNTFKAVEWFYGGKGELAAIRNTSAPKDSIVEVEITFSGVQDGLKQISNAENQTKLQNILETNDTMRVRRSSEDVKNRYLFNPKTNKWQKQPTGTDSAFNNCIPRFEFVEATKNLKDVSGYSSKTPIGQMLGGVLTEILEKDEAYRNFRNTFEALFQSETSGIQGKLKALSGEVKKHLQQQFPDCSEVRFAVEEPSFDDLLKNFTTRLNDGVETDAEEKGDGMQRALMLAIIKTHADYRRNDALGKSFIFFIDEAELHLHPTAQRQLKSALLELSQSVDQVFINTHSSVLMVDENDKQTVFKVDKTNGVTQVTPIDRAAKQDVIYQLLGGNPADLLLPCNFFIVEGVIDEIFLNKVVRRFYAAKPEIQIIPADGDDERQRQSMEAINLVYKPLALRPIYRNKLTILCEKPDAVKLPRFEEFKKEHKHLEKNGQLFVLPVGKIEEYYPARLKPAALPVNSGAKRNLAKKVGDEITQNEFETDMKIVFDALNHCWTQAYVADGAAS
jgi:putative ATP-dependent endonuclease of the OLD family